MYKLLGSLPLTIFIVAFKSQSKKFYIFFSTFRLRVFIIIIVVVE